MGEAKRRKQKSTESTAKAVVVKIEKSKITNKWLVVTYILRQRYVISPFIERDDAVNASIEVDMVFNSISYERWRKVRQGDRTVLAEAISLLSYEDDDDEIVGLLNLDTGEVILKEENPQLIGDATQWANTKAMHILGKPAFKNIN